MTAAVYDLAPHLLARRVDAAFFRPAAERALLFVCPECDAAAGESCRDIDVPHRARVDVYGEASVGWLLLRFEGADLRRPSRAALDDIHGAALARAVEVEHARKEHAVKQPMKKRRTVRVAPPKREGLPAHVRDRSGAERGHDGARERVQETPRVLQSRAADGRMSARARSGECGKKYPVTKMTVFPRESGTPRLPKRLLR